MKATTMKTAAACLGILLVTLVGANAEALPLNTLGHPPVSELRKFEFTAVFDCVQITTEPFGFMSDCQSEAAGIRTQTGYHGRFSIRESALDTDGTVYIAPDSFFFQIGATAFDSTHPCSYLNQSFCYANGYQDPIGFDRWTLVVANQRLVGLCCGVTGPGDATFIDMSTNPPNPHSASLHQADTYFGVLFFRDKATEEEGENGPLMFAQGTFTWREMMVSEPASSLLVLLIGLLALAIFSMQKIKNSQLPEPPTDVAH